MTPMVDLVLLLIVFFVFTTSMTAPNTTDLYMPEPDGPVTKTSESGGLTILLGSNDQLYFYEGILKDDGSNITKTNYTELRNAIIKKKNDVIAAYKPDAACEAEAVANKKSIEDCKQQKMMVLIKPNANANYKSIVNVIDEMTINKIARYALVDPDKTELKFFE